MKKLNNKILLIILVALAAVYAAGRYWGGVKETNLPPFLLSLDTASVSEMVVYPKANSYKEVRLVKEGKNWLVKADNKTAPIEKNTARMLLSIIPLKPIDLVTRKKERWKEYQVGDTCTRVKFMSGEKEIGQLCIGSIGFAPSAGMQYGSGSMLTHVRLSGENEVYTVEGYLDSYFNKTFNDFRDKTIARATPADVTKISFQYPADSSFVVQKTNKLWTIGNEAADSTQVKNYVDRFSALSATQVLDDFTPSTAPDAVLTLSKDLTTLVEIKAWKRETDWAIQSSALPNVTVSSKGLEFLWKAKKTWKQKV